MMESQMMEQSIAGGRVMMMIVEFAGDPSIAAHDGHQEGDLGQQQCLAADHGHELKA